MNEMQLLSPRALQVGDTLGVFTPSAASYLDNPGLFENGVKNLERLGFRIKLGSLTQRRAGEGYRSGSGPERAQEFMDLIMDPDVDGLISTIGGSNSSSMIPFLNFQAIRESRKVICGFSDVTSLHLAILKFSGLRTFYGPSLMCWFGEWPDGVPESAESFLQAVTHHKSGSRELVPPKKWSNHRRNWKNGDWKTLPRIWQENPGWKVLNPGSAEGSIVAANLNTLMSAAGTSYWPDLEEKILLVEEMEAPLAMEERALRQLELMGVFDQIAGLLVGKPEVYDAQEASFGLDELIMEILGPDRDFPVITQFDCGHTLPMLTIPQLALMQIEAQSINEGPKVTLLEPSVQGNS